MDIKTNNIFLHINGGYILIPFDNNLIIIKGYFIKDPINLNKKNIDNDKYNNLKDMLMKLNLEYFKNYLDILDLKEFVINKKEIIFQKIIDQKKI